MESNSVKESCEKWYVKKLKMIKSWKSLNWLFEDTTDDGLKLFVFNSYIKTVCCFRRAKE